MFELPSGMIFGMPGPAEDEEMGPTPRDLSRTLHLMSNVDATDPRLMRKLRSDKDPTVTLFGSPHINVLGEQKPMDQMFQPSA